MGEWAGRTLWAMNSCPGPVGATGVRGGALAVAERMTARDGEGTAGNCLSASAASVATA